MYVTDDVSRRGSERTFAVDDGRGQGTRHQTVHWRIGRLVLDAIAPGPTDAASALLWYRATAAYLLREGHFGEADAHLERAAQVFPSSPDVCLDNAYLREKFASPEIQAAVQDFKMQGVTLNVLSVRTELARAERFFRQTLALDPARLEARIRLGRVLGDLGRHQEAAAELREALAAHPDGASRYFAELFLGREQETTGDRDNARAHFQAAAELFPDAQSPYLALSQLARQSGDRAAALRALRRMTALPADELARLDPWWAYYTYHADDVGELIDAVRARAFEVTQ
jgi:tetratricopeptide (TPR) repeat protein